MTADAPATGSSGQDSISFVAYCDPPWQSGTYTLTAGQTVQGTGVDASYGDSLTFVVSGPRFALPGAYIQQTFPPAGGSGAYSNVLPHVVMTVKTLPWQRNPATTGQGSPPSSWLAVLLFDQNDPAPAIVQGTVQDLLPAGAAGLSGTLPSGILSYPDLATTLEPADAWIDGAGTLHYAPLSYIDVPAALFAEIAPAAADLPYVAHARVITPDQTAQKATVGGVPPGTEYSVVVGNRLPTAGNASLCCLVSLEGMQGCLPGGGSLNGATAVRLAVLASWSFGTLPTATDVFLDRFDAIGAQPALLRIPAPSNAGAAVQAALGMGYTAMNHATRQGASTVSWYRGPLLPYQNSQTLQPPFGSADGLLRYDPTSGMFDVSYAAAWQLGQLLALNDKDFATTLYNWKVGQQLSAVSALETSILTEQLGLPQGTLDGGAPLQTQLMQSAIKPALTQLLNKGSQS